MWAILDIKRRVCLRDNYFLVYLVHNFLFRHIFVSELKKKSAIIPESTNVFFHVKHFTLSDAIYVISAQHNRLWSELHRSASAQKKNEPTLLCSALIKKKFVIEVNSFAFNGNSLHCNSLGT